MAENLPVHFAGERGNAVLLAQKFVGEILYNGCTAVDATMGNGYDTVFLAKRVGPLGKVYAFDIQQLALDITARRLEEEGLSKRVNLIRDGHEFIQKYVKEPVDCVLFNLGYLPGGDHNLTTRPGTTVRAVNTSLQLLKPGGRIGIVVYTGHSGASEESAAILEFASCLAPGKYGVLHLRFANRPHWAPFLILIEKVVPRR